MRLLPSLLLALVAGCAPSPSASPGTSTEVTVRGTVVSVDLAPMAYDGNAVLLVATDDGEARVEIPARTNLCTATGLSLVSGLRPGDAVVVVGARTESGAIVPCTSAGHSLQRAR